MPKYFTITILSILLILLILPQTVNAESIVPCGRDCNKWSEDMKQCLEAAEGVPLEEAQPCNLCHAFKLIQRFTKLAGFFALGWMALFIVLGGIVILTATGVPERISQGKRMITYSLIGVIIAFGAWIIINTVMNLVVNPEKMPWPWDKIQCVPTQSHKECANNICTDVSGAGTNQCSTNTDCIGGTGERKYCVCETPVYDLNPNNFPGEASVIGTNAKITSTLSSQQECLQKCVAANASTYCMASLKPQTAIYCASETELKNKKACTLNAITADCQISTQGFPKTNPSLATCVDNSSCIDLVTPGSSVYNSTLAKRCWIDGTLLCRCEGKGAAPNPCQLYRYNQEQSPGGTSLFDCDNVPPNYCRLACKYDKCSQLVTNTCNQLSPPLGQTASCFGGKFTCQQGIIDQEKEACGELEQLLNCMANKSLPAAAREISSIADNSPPLAGSLPGCFQTWTSQCSVSTDSCTGTCCGHGPCSLHYGGKARTGFGPTSACGIGSVDCRNCSWAVDFANESYLNQIKTAAQTCGKELWDGALEEVYVDNEGNHVHVGLNGIAKYHKCYKSN